MRADDAQLQFSRRLVDERGAEFPYFEPVPLDMPGRSGLN